MLRKDINPLRLLIMIFQMIITLVWHLALMESIWQIYPQMLIT